MKVVVGVQLHTILLLQLAIHLVEQVLVHHMEIIKRQVTSNIGLSQNMNSFTSDQSRTPNPTRAKKATTNVNVATKKNISMVKEEDEDGMHQVKRFFLFSSCSESQFNMHLIHIHLTGSTQLLEYSTRFRCKSNRIYIVLCIINIYIPYLRFGLTFFYPNFLNKTNTIISVLLIIRVAHLIYHQQEKYWCFALCSSLSSSCSLTYLFP